MSKEAKGAEPPKEEAKQDAAPEVGQMKRGDYMIHVFIEQARQLKCPDGNTVDPMIEVTVMNQKKFTTAKDDIGVSGVCTWNEHLFFEPKNVDVETIESSKISIRILDKGYFKDAVIGAYDFDITYIYFMKQHALMHKWLALSNPQSQNFNEVTGYLKLSISIAATGDEQIQINEDSGADKTDDEILMPPSIRPEFQQVRFKFFRAEKLPAMDKNLLGGLGSIDAYIQCHYLNQKLKTAVITQKEGMALDWDQEFLIPCQLPIMSSRIVMKLFDEDKISDEIVGSILFNLKECIGNLNGKFFWKNIYGSPLGCSGENTDNMNANPESASTWKGRILMQITAEKTEKPQLLCQKISETDKELAQQYLQPSEYDIIAEVGMGISLPSDEKYSVMIKIADLELKTEQAVYQEGTYNRWNHRFKQQTFKVPYQDAYDMGRVYVYLMQGTKPICYWKTNIEEFLDPNPSFKWVELLPDLSIGKVTEPHKAGIISFKLSIHHKSKDGPINFEHFDAWKKPPQKRLPVKKVRAFIFQCRDLPAADSDGQSDPFIKVWDCGKERKQTVIIYDNLNPIFYQTLELSFEAPSPTELPPFVFDIYDKDKIGEDFICRALIDIKDSAHSFDDEVPRPKWHPCRLKPGSPSCGEVLASFSIVDDDYSYKIPLKYMNLKENVNFQEFMININILGLRELQSVGILPVKKAFIVFNLKSLVPPDEGTALENIKTQPGPVGANPTINQSIKFNLPLPTDPLFCPRLSCQVHDYIFKGFSQPMIGAFTIPIGDLIKALKDEREEETKAIQDVNYELAKILEGQGIMSYSIQGPLEESKSGEDLENLNLIQQQETKVKTKLRMSVKGDIEMQKPLLSESKEVEMDDQRTKSQNSLLTPSQRRTPQNLTSSMQGDKKSRSNTFLIPQFDKFNSGMKKDLLKEMKENKEKAKRELEDNRNRDAQEYKKAGGGVKNLVMPQYQLDKRLNVYREMKMPPDTIYIGMGWDETPEDKRRHYRRYFPDELENITEIMPVPTPFHQYKIMKGQSRGASKGWWPFGGHREDESGAVSTEQVMGKFKGIVTVESEQDKIDYQEKKTALIHDLKVKLNKLSIKQTGNPIEIKLEKLDTMEGRAKFDVQMEKLGVGHLNITKHLVNIESDETLKRMLMSKTKCIVRLYMINAYDLASRDNGSFSDPYLKIACGKKEYNERNNYQQDNPNPDFYKMYDFEAEFPGCPPLVIDVVDYDDIFGDDSIGKTSIDLEDRYFSPEWQSIKNKPVEYRQLYHESSSVSQGVVKCWVEIHPTTIPINEIPIFDISPKPAEEFEVRLVIYDTQDILMMDMEGTSDVYCRAFFDSREEVHETDTHYRCQNGKASFNYRLLYKVSHPRKDYRLTIQAYDRDFFKSNDIIGDVVLDLKNAFLDCSLTKRPLSINKTYYEAYMKDSGFKAQFKDANSFWVTIKGADEKTGEIKDHGKIRIQVDIYPKAQAEANKVGEARQEPNHSPFLPPPVGRISFTLNPFKMFQQLVGPAMRRKIYCICCCVLCCMMCLFLFPLIFGNIISSCIMGNCF